MNDFIAIPLTYRLVGIFIAGALLGYLANLAAYVLSRRPERNAWSAAYPDRGKTRWFARLPFIGWPIVVAARLLVVGARWFARLPLAGWLWLSRQSSQLGRAFWVRAVLAEFGMGGACAALYWWEVAKGMVASGGQVAAGAKIPPSPITWEILHAVWGAHVLLMLLMLAATLIDFDELIIPDQITVPGTLLALMLAAGYAWTLMPVDVYVKPPGIQQVEFMTLIFPQRSYPDEWPEYLEAPAQSLPLFVALAVYWFWCLSLLPWLWLPRRGLEKAVRMFIGHATRAVNFSSTATIAVCGGAAITMVWWLGGPGWAALLSSLAGLAMGGGLIWAVRLIFSAILGKEAMGFGDVTLLAMIGAFLGWQAPIFIFFVAPCIGLVFGLVQLILGLGREIPYGPFLCLATMIVIVFWRSFWERFMVLFRPLGDLAVPFVLLVIAACVVGGCLLALPIYVFRSRHRSESRAA